MADRVLLVLPTASYRADAFLAAARRQGVEVVLASDRPSTLAALAGATEVVIPELGAGEAASAADRARRVAASVGEQLAAPGAVGVVGVDESAVLVAAAIAEHLGLPRHHPLDAVAATRDKRLLRTRLAAASIPQPRWAATRTEAGGGALAEAVDAVGGYPVVVKPVDQAASRGVLRCEDAAALRSAVSSIERILVEACAAPGPFPLLVEAYVEGAEVAVEAIADRGVVRLIAILDKPEPLRGPIFEETIFVTPSRHPPAMQAAITGLCVSAARALGLCDGPLHAEIRLPISGPVVVEVAARSIGGLCSRALRLGAEGLSLEEAILRQALSLGADDVERTGPPTGVLMLPTPRGGRLRELRGVEAARAVRFVTTVDIAVPLGAMLRPLPEGDRYLGFVFAEAPTALEVERALRAAQGLIEAVVD